MFALCKPSTINRCGVANVILQIRNECFVPMDGQPHGGVMEGWWVILRNSTWLLMPSGLSSFNSDDWT